MSNDLIALAIATAVFLAIIYFFVARNRGEAMPETHTHEEAAPEAQTSSTTTKTDWRAQRDENLRYIPENDVYDAWHDEDDDEDDDEDALLVFGKPYKPNRPSRPEWRPTRNYPEGMWRQITTSIEIAGLGRRKKEARSFVAAAKQAEREGRTFGITPKRAPNSFDENSIELWGVCKDREWMLGFVLKEWAKNIAEGYPNDMPLAASVHEVAEKAPYIDIYVNLLAPGTRDPYWIGKDCPFKKGKGREGKLT